MIHKAGIGKKITLALMMSMLVLFSGFLFACQKQSDKLTVSVNTESINIYLGETQDNEQTIIATISNVSDDIAKSIHVSSDNTKTAIQDVTYLGNGRSQITIKGLVAGDSTITIQSKENINKKATVLVKNIQPVTALIEKQLTTKNYVLRGGRTLIDVNQLITFYPTTTEQKNVSISITSNSYSDRVRIENGYLVVETDTPTDVTSVSLTIESTDRNINPILLSFDILEPFNKNTILLSSTVNHKYLMPSDINANPIIYLAHNEDSTSTDVIRIQVPLIATKTINIEPIVTNPLLAKITKTQTYTANGYKVLDVYLQSGNSIGSDAYLYFNISYSDYSYVFSTQNFKTQIYSYDIITDIYVNNNLAEDEETLDLYTNYANSINGLELSFEAFPTTVANEYKSFYISIPISSQGVINLYSYNTNGSLSLLTQTDSEGRYIITHGQKIVVRAVSGLAVSQAQILVESVFTATFYEGTENTKQVTINFDIHEGVNDVYFYGTSQVNPLIYLDNSKVTPQKVYFIVQPHNADMTTAEFETTGNFTLVSNSLTPEPYYNQYDSNSEIIGKAYSVQIKSNGDLKESSGMLRINFGNGRYISTEVKTVIPFDEDNLVISTSSPSQNSAVGFYQKPYSYGDFKVAISLGSSINFNIGSNGSKFNATYSYYSLTSEESNYDDFENFDINNLSFDTPINVISSTDLSAFSLISGRAIGKVVVKIVFNGKNLVDNEMGIYKVLEDVPQSLIKYFYVEVYNPIKTYQTNKSTMTLYSYDSVGFYNSSFSQDTVKVLINANTTSATYSSIQYLTSSNLGIYTQSNPYGKITVEKVLGSVNEYRIFALTTESGDDIETNSITGQLIFSTTEFGRTYTTIIQITIIKAKRVEEIVLNNVNEDDGIYLEASSYSSTIIDATVSNNDAFNKKMKYFFEPDIGVSSSILTVNADTGLISVKTIGQGGTGYVVVAPQDVFVESDGQAVIFDKNNVVKRIRIVVADGRTRETSYRITELTQITDFTAHYTLIQDISVPSDWTSATSKWNTTNFTGGLYGKELYSDVIHTITNNVNALFNTIGQGGLVEDLIIVGQISGTATGFVANQNSGTIKNVTVDTYLVNSKYSPSILTNNLTGTTYVGGLVGINTSSGLITNSAFYGQVIGNSFVGGIAGQNSGTLNFVSVELYTYEKDTSNQDVYGKIISNSGNAGGLVGIINSLSSRIYDSYIYSYHNQVSVQGTNSGAIVGTISTTNSIIARVFTRTSSTQIAGNYELNNTTETAAFGLSNAYFYTYTLENSTADTLKIVAPDSRIIHNPMSIYQNFASFYSQYGITFLSTTPWAISVSKNNGYPYLRSILQETAPSNLTEIKLQTLSNVLADNIYNKAVFFLYEKASNLTTTTQENAVIKNWNTISFTKLFGITNANGLRINVLNTTDQTKLFDITSSSLIMSSVGNDVTLTIFSKYDYSIKKTYTVSVYYAINNFAFSYHGEELDNSAIVNIKKGSSDIFIATYKTDKVAVDRKIELKQSSFAITFAHGQEQYVTRSSNVVFSINTSSFNDTTEWFTVSPNDSTRVDANDYVNALLSKAYSKTFGVSTYQGASSLNANVSEIIRMMSSDSISFTVEMITDDVKIYGSILEEYEKLNIIVTDLYGNTMFTAIGAQYNYLFENGVSQYGNTTYYNGQDMATLESFALLTNGFYKLTYKVRLNIDPEYRDYNFNGLELFLRIESENLSSVYQEIKVILESQSINTIFVTSHEYKGDWAPDGYAFETEPNNVISPGSSALLNVNLFPEYASYQYIEVTSSVVNSNSVIMNLMKLNSTTDRYTRVSTGFTAITNGIRISKNQIQLLAGSSNSSSNVDGSSNLARFFILATIPYTVSIDTVFVVTIRAFNSLGEEIKSTEFNLITRPLISAEITVDGESQLLMARGTSAQAVVTVQLDQELSSASISAEKDGNGLGDVYGVSLSGWTETIDQAKNVRVYTFDVSVSELAKFINSPTPSFYVEAIVRRKIGEIFEEKKTSVKITVVDFLIDQNSIKVETDSVNENVIETYVGLSKSINFSFDTTTWELYGYLDPELDEAIAQLEAQVASFKEHNYFYNEDPQSSGSKYILNYHVGDTPGEKYKNFLNNLYYVNSNGTTTKVISENGVLISNDIITFEYAGNGISSTVENGKLFNVIGLTTGSQTLRFIFSILTPLGTKIEYSYDFTINVTVYTDEDSPTQITSVEEFLNIQNQTEAQDYILMTDIELTNYTPFETSKLRSLDGNNKVITIRSFNLTQTVQSTSISLALFTTIASSTTLKNITVNYYHLNNMVINTTTYKTINFAGFAITNNGIITNCHVLAFKTNSNLPTPSGNVGMILNYSIGNITSGITSTIAGFVINNNSSGSITNSRVGGTTFQIVNGNTIQTGIYKLSLFTISGQGNIAGFVYSNSGFVSSSYTNNIGITNNTLVGKETITSGFAGYNSGNIKLSYSKGAYSTSNANEVRTTGSGIASSSVGSGFVYENTGYIGDSYSNIMIKDVAGVSGRYGAGFVYKNSGTIEKAYSSSVIENSKTTQMSFSGVDDYGNLLTSNGTIINSYYYNPSDSNLGDMEEEYSSGVLRIDSFTNSEVFYGFSFANINSLDGVWVMTSSKGPDLISANEIAISSRYFKEISGNDILPYQDGYEYGSDKNPIIIRTAQEFNNVFGNATSSAISSYFDLTQKAIFGNYRIVTNIDFSTLASSQTGDYKLISSEMKLTKGAVVDGNGFTLSNLELVSSVTNQNKFYGLFAYMEGFSIVKNMNINLIEISASNVQHVGTIAGAIENSKIVNIAISAKDTNSTALVLGQNIVGGVVGLVMGDSSLISLSTTNISVTADYYNDSASVKRQYYIRQDKLTNHNNSAISYAGGIVGILDIYSSEYFSVNDYSQDKLMSFSQSSSFIVKGKTQVRGGTVGGVIGYVGINTSVRNADFEITQISGVYSQKIIAYKYAAGGIIGECYGDVTQSKIEHSYSAQMLIEANLSNYYNTTATVSRGYEELFTSSSNFKPLFVGGLIGQVLSGKISNSYSKANVIASNANATDPLYIGGIVGAIGDHYYSSSSNWHIGLVRFEEVYSFGSLRILNNTNVNSACGGIAGFIEYVPEGTINLSNVEVSITFDGVNAVTYFDKTYLESDIDSTSNQMKYVYDFYGYTYYNNAFVNSTEFEQKLIILTNLSATAEPVNYVMSDLVLVVGGENVTYSPKRSKYILATEQGETPTEFNDRIISLKYIANVANDSSYMDIVFRNNNWDQEKWERKDKELLPSIVFTVATSIYYIRVADDFNLMEKHPDKTFIIIGTGENGTNRVLIDMSTITNKTLETIKNFRGVLKGYMPKTEIEVENPEPLFGIKNLTGRTKALIESAINGAIFADFLVIDSGNDDMIEGALLVGTSSGVVYRNIIFENIKMASSKENIGIITSTATNCMFDTIKIIHNIRSQIIIANLKKPTAGINVGLLAGKVDSNRRTTLKEITIQIKPFGSTTYGIFVSSPLTFNDSILRKVNIGGYFGLANGEVEISSDISTTFIQNLLIQFSGYTNCDDYYIVNAGAIGGFVKSAYVDLTSIRSTKSTSVSFDISGQFKSEIPTKPALAVGGFFGKVESQLTVLGAVDKTYIVPKIDITNAYVVTQSDINSTKQPSIYVGGVAGHTSGIVSIEYVEIQNKLDDNHVTSLTSNVNIDALNNSVYASGLIGFASGQFSLDNVIVNSAFFVDINSELTAGVVLNNKVDSYFGDALAFFSDSNKTSSLSIKNSYFFGRYEISNTPNITYGGVLGASVRTEQMTEGYNRVIEANVTGGNLTINRVADSKIIAGGIIGNSNKTTSTTEPSKDLKIKNNITYGDINLNVVSMSNYDKVTMGGIAGRGDTKLTFSGNVILTTLYSTRTSLTSGNYLVNAVVGNESYNVVDFDSNVYSSQLNLATEENAQNLSYSGILSEITTLSTIINKQFSGSAENLMGTKLYPYSFSQISSTNGNSYFRQYYKVSENLSYNSDPILMDGVSGSYAQFNKAVIGEGKTITLTGSAYRLFDIIDSQSFVSGISLKVSTLDYTVLASTALYPTVFAGANYTYKNSEEELVSYQMYAPLTAVNEGVIFGSGISGINTSFETEFNNENAQKLYAKFILNNVNLAGGLVALNNGYIADSFTSVDITNITGKLNDFLSITSGFVGINQGDITTSYSSGVINALYGKTYSFGSDQIDTKYQQDGSDGTSFVPSVRNSFTIAQSSKALEEVNENGLNVTSYAGVFGEYADDTNFYDVYATQTKSKEGATVRYITQQISKLQSEDSISNWTTYLKRSNFDYDVINNFGYPSFQKAYKKNSEISGSTFDFMRQVTSSGNAYIISSLGKLQQLSSLISVSKNTINYNLYLINDLEITDDMGFVSNRITEWTNINVGAVGTWDSFAINKTTIEGNDYTISNFSVITNLYPFNVGVDVNDGNGESIINDKTANGFFTTLNNSAINNLILADSQVILNEYVYDEEDVINSLGAFAGKTTTSEINNSKNLGVLVQSNGFGQASGSVGGIVGFASSYTKIKNTINTGNVISICSDQTEYVYHFGIFAGGIAGCYSNNTAFLNNQNYGLVMAEQNENYNEAYATGIGYNESVLPTNLTSENNRNNANFGEVRVQINTTDNVFVELKTGQAFSLFKQSTNSTFSVSIINNNSTYLPTDFGDNPVLIYNNLDLINCFTEIENKSALNGQFLLMKNIEIGQLNGLMYVEEFLGTIYGNEKLISYYGYLGTDNIMKNDRTFIKEIKQDSAINNLKILGVSKNAQNNVSILANENDGTIYKTNTYGAITGTSGISDLVNYIISGMINNNNGNIVLSSNYTLLKGTSGIDATPEINSMYNLGRSANNLGGLVGTTYGPIVYSSNYGALIGGDGGDGHDGAAGEKGKDSVNKVASEPGTDGGDGTHGGDASIIGGVVVYANKGNEEILVTGSNNGIIIAGKGGNGGNGGVGGAGGNADAQTGQDVYNYVVIATAYAAVFGSATYGIGGVVVDGIAAGIIHACYSDYFDHPELYKASDGGVGGAGGNGGNTIVADIVGINTDSDISITPINLLNSGSITYSNAPGIGGTGGNGGNGGKGLKYAKNGLAAVTYQFNYEYAGDGGGAGGAGYSGNTEESLINARTNTLVNVAKQGGLYDENGEIVDSSQGGEGSVAGGDGIKGETLVSYILGWDNVNAEKYLPKGGQGNSAAENYSYEQSNNGVGLNPINLTRDEDGNYEINSWDELKLAIGTNDDPSLKYILQKEFLFGYTGTNSETQEFVFETFKSLPSFVGTITAATGGKISIKGSYSKLNIVSKLNSNSLFYNVPIDLDIENYGQVFVDDYQFISSNYSNYTGNLDIITFSGTIKSTYTESQMQILSDNNNSDFTWTYKQSSLTVGSGTENDPFIINSDIQWDEFETLVDMGSTHYFKLDRTFAIKPNENELYYFSDFYAHLDGNGYQINLGQLIDEIDEGVVYKFNSFIYINHGTISNVTFSGIFANSAIAYTNKENVLITNVTVNGTIESTSQLAGFVIENYGIIQNSTNNASLTSTGGAVAGIAISNYGLIQNVANTGNLKSADGIDAYLDGENNIVNATNGSPAAGIVIYNGYDGSSRDEQENQIKGLKDVHNTGNITAGKAGLTYLDQGGNAYGGDASGIAIYNISVSVNNVEIDEENEIQITYTYFIGLIVSENGTSNTGIITAGNGSSGSTDNTGGNAGYIVIYNSIENEVTQYTGYLVGTFTQSGSVSAGTPGGIIYVIVNGQVEEQ